MNLVTGAIMAALGVETSTGEFNVVDVCFAGMADGVRATRARLLKEREKAGKGKGKGKVESKDEDKMDVDCKRSFPAGESVFCPDGLFLVLLVRPKASSGGGKWIALVSGLELSSAPAPTADPTTAPTDLSLQLLIEYLKGESGGEEDQKASREIGRLVILGNSLDVPKRAMDDLKGTVRVFLISRFNLTTDA